MRKCNKGKNVEIENLKIIEAEAEACVAIVTKEDFDKVIERENMKRALKR